MLKEISVELININPCTLIGKQWMLITAGTEQSFNTMTASWGHIGALWGQSVNGRPTVEVFIRPSRYTDKFVDENDCFSLTFFDEQYRKDLAYLGSHSGKDVNKITKTKLTPFFIDGVPAFKEAKMVIVARKIYKGKIEENNFIDKTIIKAFYNSESGHAYNNDSYHNVYIAEIIKVFVNE